MIHFCWFHPNNLLEASMISITRYAKQICYQSPNLRFLVFITLIEVIQSLSWLHLSSLCSLSSLIECKHPPGAPSDLIWAPVKQSLLGIMLGRKMKQSYSAPKAQFLPELTLLEYTTIISICFHPTTFPNNFIKNKWDTDIQLFWNGCRQFLVAQNLPVW